MLVILIIGIIAWFGPQVQELHGRLNGEWDLFQHKLIDCDQTLQEQKEKFKNSLLLSSQDFREKTKTSLTDFAQKGQTFCCLCFTLTLERVEFYQSVCALTGPFNSSLGCDSALKEIAGFRNQLKALRQEESTVLQGLGFFEIEQPPFKAIKILEKVCPCFILMMPFLTQRHVYL